MQSIQSIGYIDNPFLLILTMTSLPRNSFDKIQVIEVCPSHQRRRRKIVTYVFLIYKKNHILFTVILNIKISHCLRVVN